ncbi:predicted protein [Naegleria gruberi]|uniref:Predicted protein n=1 Tax=Naegleria gruberi TaxID=5762 RepID=D2VLD4_NAEGR|nr:uncharacterized protein NAEGRDRAFT_50506 [Naegleria gruberi]EFC42369.1 predicted protein [Naegleria gruberi]|eukprot:XP_002675113.1 predicted protein [Naegleria gruberi strain NEG-M]
MSSQHPSINHRIVLHPNSDEDHHIVDMEDNSENSSSGLESPLSNSDPSNQFDNHITMDNQNNTLRKELYESVHFTNRILLIEGIYSFYLDDSIFVLGLRVFQSMLMYYSFVHSTQPTILGRVFKNMNLKKKISLVLIIVLPLLYIHIANYVSNENYYRRSKLYKKENEYFELIDFFEQENLFTSKKKIFDNVKVGVYFPDQNIIETEQDQIIEKHFDMKFKTNQQEVKQIMDIILQKKVYESQQAIRIDSESITLFDNHPGLFVIYLCLFDIIFAIIQVSHVTTLAQLMKLLNNPNNSYFNSNGSEQSSDEES